MRKCGGAEAAVFFNFFSKNVDRTGRAGGRPRLAPPPVADPLPGLAATCSSGSRRDGRPATANSRDDRGRVGGAARSVGGARRRGGRSAGRSRAAHSGTEGMGGLAPTRRGGDQVGVPEKENNAIVKVDRSSDRSAMRGSVVVRRPSNRRVVAWVVGVGGVKSAISLNRSTGSVRRFGSRKFPGKVLEQKKIGNIGR